MGCYPLQYSWAFLMAQMVENLPAMWETWVQSLGWKDPLVWHFGGQRALDHLLGWEREGSTNCTLET